MKTSKLLWRMIRYKPLVFLVNCFFIMTTNTIPILTGLLIKGIFDTISGKSKLGFSLMALLAVLVATYLARIVTFYLAICCEVVRDFSITSLLRRNLLEGILDLPGAKSTSKTTGDILSSFRDDVSQVEDYVGQIIDVIAMIMYVVISLIILLKINSKITLVVFTPLTVIVVIAKLASTRITKYRKESRAATSNVDAVLGEVFNSVQAIQVANAEEYVLENFNKASEQRQKLTIKDDMFSQFLKSIFGNTVSLGTGLILLLAAQYIKTGNFTIGDFSIFVYYLATITDFTQFLGNFLAQYKQTEVSFDRLSNLISPSKLVEHKPLYLKRDIPELYAPIKRKKLDTLEVKNLNFKYSDAKTGIENINFKVKKNSLTVITGRVGSGKTTLIRTLLGLLPYDSGEIQWNGKAIDNCRDFFVPPNSAYTAQIPHLFSDTVKNNILLNLNDKQMDIDSVIKSAVLEHDINELENGLETVIGSRGAKLSGGQQQRVAAARMFARKPELLVFDDISSALDVETESTLWKRIFEGENSTCLAVSNRRMVLKQADHIIVLKAGKVEAQGKLTDLMRECEEMQLIWGD